MAGKRGDIGTKVVTGIAGAAASFVARKAIVFAWKKITGKEPPEPEDPQAALAEALVFGLVLGAGVSAARLLATRAAGRHQLQAASKEADAEA